MATKTIASVIVLSVASAFISLISICLAVQGPQIIKSYPLAINFDGYQNKPNGIRFQQVRYIQQSTSGGGLWDSTRTASSMNSHPKLQISEPQLGIQRRRQLMSAKPRHSPHESISWSESSTSYKKRTLDGEIPLSSKTGPNGDESVDRDKSSMQRGNSSTVSESQKLITLRKKMIEAQGHTNVSIEDTNWKIAAGCLMNQYGSQFLRNKDVKCASSQVVLSISRMHRAGCKSCDAYFHCEGFSNALKRCKDNYDVRDTLNVMRECQGLTNTEQDSIEATRAPLEGTSCQKYLCGKKCNYNPSDGTCPRNNCYQAQVEASPRSSYISYIKDRRGRLTNVAYPIGSPMRNRTTEPSY